LPSNNSNAPAQPPAGPPVPGHRLRRSPPIPKAIGKFSQVRVGGSQPPAAVVLKCRLWFTPQPQRPQYCEHRGIPPLKRLVCGRQDKTRGASGRAVEIGHRVGHQRARAGLPEPAAAAEAEPAVCCVLCAVCCVLCVQAAAAARLREVVHAPERGHEAGGAPRGGVYHVVRGPAARAHGRGRVSCPAPALTERARAARESRGSIGSLLSLRAGGGRAAHPAVRPRMQPFIGPDAPSQGPPALPFETPSFRSARSRQRPRGQQESPRHWAGGSRRAGAAGCATNCGPLLTFVCQ
jgi:hypothetical protein